jgi:hypothetical protein
MVISAPRNLVKVAKSGAKWERWDVTQMYRPWSTAVLVVSFPLILYG